MKSFTQFLTKHSIYLLVLVAQVGYGQDLCFFAKDTVGCAPFKIEIEDCGNETKPTFYSYDNGVTATQTSSFTFAKKGTYDIWQFKGVGVIDTLIKKQYITVLDNPKPLFTLSACADFVIHINIDNNNYDQYVVSYNHTFPNDTILGNTSIQKQFLDNTHVSISVKGIYNEATCFNSFSEDITPIQDIITPTIDSLVNQSENESNLYFTQHSYHTYTVFSSTNNTLFSTENNIETNSTFYKWSNSTSKSVYLRTNDACGNSKLSDSLSTISLSGNANNNVNTLNWLSISLGNQAVIRDKNSILDTDTKSYNDTQINCGETYSYVIQQQHNNSLVKSNAINLKAISTNIPPPLSNFYTTVTDNKVTFSWSNNTVKTLHVYDQQLTLQSSLDVTQNNTVESGFSPTTSSCFYVNYTDICDNKSRDSDTVTSCNSVLTHQISSTNDFSWSPYVSPNSVSSYILEWYDTDFNLIESKNVNNSLTHSSHLIFDGAQYYHIKVKIILNNDSVAYTNSVYIEQDAIIKLPTAFSPNDDGLNDTFKPLTLFIKEYTMTILTTDNKVLYEGTEWNGETKEHSFVYLIEYTDQRNKKKQLSGSGSIIK